MEKSENANMASMALAKAKRPGTLAGLKHTQVQDVLNGMKAQIAQALPKHLTADRMVQMACTLITKNPKLAECSVQSLVGSVMQASILGFRPVEALGECYFVPYGGHVQFQVGYKGYINLGRRSGDIKTIYAEVVRENDQFHYELGLDPKLVHIPDTSGTGKVTHAYAVAKYKDDGYNFIVLTASQINALRMRNPMQKSGVSGAWATDYEAMAKAKAIKQLAKYMPLSVDFANAVISDEAVITEKSFSNDQTGLKIEEFTYESTQPVDIESEVVDEKINMSPEPEEAATVPLTYPLKQSQEEPRAPVIKPAKQPKKEEPSQILV